jgi:HK97 family phage major capsid protein
MSDLSEIKSLIEAQNTVIAKLRETTEDIQAKAQKSGATGDLEAKLAKVTADLDTVRADHKKAMEDFDAKSRRPAIGADGKPVDEVQEEHKKAFRGYLTKGTDFDRSLEAKALSISSGADGGYAVPKVIDAMIDALAVNISPIRSIATVQQISTSDFHKLVNVRGTTSGWVGETQTRAGTNAPTLVDIAPPMGELYAKPSATQQMLDDVFFNAEQWLSGEIATEFARAEGAAHVSGTGVNQPKGFSSYTTAATGDATRAFGTIEHVATGASGAFKTLTSTVNPADDLFSLVSKLKAAYRPGSSWVTNKAVLYTIMAFKDYQGRYVFAPTTAPDVKDTIMGYPVVEAEDIPALAANSLSLWFGNFKAGYLIVDRIGTRVIRDPFSNKPYVDFYVTKRTGGSCMNTEAIKALKFA